MRRTIFLFFIVLSTALNTNAQKLKPGVYREYAPDAGSLYTPKEITLNRNGTYKSDVLHDFPRMDDGWTVYLIVGMGAWSSDFRDVTGTYTASDGTLSFYVQNVSKVLPNHQKRVVKWYKYSYDNDYI